MLAAPGIAMQTRQRFGALCSSCCAGWKKTNDLGLLWNGAGIALAAMTAAKRSAHDSPRVALPRRSRALRQMRRPAKANEKGSWRRRR